MNASFTHVLIYIQTTNAYQVENCQCAHRDFSSQSRTRNTNVIPIIFTLRRYLLTKQFIKAQVPTPGQNWVLLALKVKELREVSSQQPARTWILSKELKALVHKYREELNSANNHVSTLGRDSSCSQAFQRSWRSGQYLGSSSWEILRQRTAKPHPDSDLQILWDKYLLWRCFFIEFSFNPQRSPFNCSIDVRITD